MNPEVQQLVQTILLRTMLVSMMLAMGLRLTVTSLTKVFRRFGLVSWVLVTNFVVVPAVALGLVLALDVGAESASGIIVCACTPGGTVAALLSRNARGHVPTAVAMLLLLVFSSLVITPFAVDYGLGLLGDEVGSFETGGALETILFFQLIPLALGMILHWRRPKLSAWLEPFFARFATILLLIVVVGFLVARGHLITVAGWKTVVTVLAIVVLSFALGAAFPGAPGRRVSSAFTSGSKNMALSTLLVEQYLTDVAFFSVMILGLFTYMILLPATPLMKRLIEKAEASGDRDGDVTAGAS
jgi:BASS family bile acid:Na+ symporter